MSALKKSVLVLFITSLAGCGQQLVEFGNPGGNNNNPGVPTVTSTDPVDTATDVGVSRTVNATFSEEMDPATITAATFTLKQGETSISGSVRYAGMTATFQPATDLSSDTAYSATVLTGAESAASATSLAANYSWTFRTGGPGLPPPALAINLRGAASFGLASRAGMSSTGVTVVNGNVALYPNPVCTDATGGPGSSGQSCKVKTYASSTGMTVNGSIYFAADPFDNGGTANSVTNDLQIAWNEGKSKVDNKGAIAADQIGGKILVAGIYHNANLGLAAGGVATLDAQNDANAVFIFKVDSTFVDSGTLLLKSRIDLINGAQARNVWFVTGEDLTIGSGTTWNGNILVGGTATIKDGSTVNGRVLAGASGAGALTLTGAASPSKTTITVPK